MQTLDRLFKSKRLTESITQKLFIADLIELFKPLSLTPNDPLSQTVAHLLHTISEFLDLLVAVHNTPLGDAYQIMDTLRLMEFLRTQRKEDMFIRYVHALVAVQLSSSNLIEAGLSLKLHADLYPWSPTERVPPLEDPAFPEQTAFERREQLFLEMISYFEDGRAWDLALSIYRELAREYEHTTFDFAKLARCNRAIAQLQEQILHTPRPEPRFYRVAYFGLGFPTGLRDRHFIVQAGAYELSQSFADRMLLLHPEARLTETAVDGLEGQWIQIVPVTAEVDYSHPVWRKTKVPANVRAHLAKREVRTFAVVHEQREVEMAEWSEKTVFMTEEAFPTILKRSEIVETEVVGVSPIERAIEEVLRRTEELVALEKRFNANGAEGGEKMDITPLSVALTAAVDATKSVAPFRELIEGSHDTSPELRDALKTIMLDHVGAIRKALSTHGQIVPDHLRAVQSNCSRCKPLPLSPSPKLD